MKIAKDEPNIVDLLTSKNPYKNIYTNEIKYLDIQEWMVAESRGKQQLLQDLAHEAISNAVDMPPEEFNNLLNKQQSHLNKIVIWEILEDKPSLQILFGKKDI